MKNKKGFTLVELLAVIVILALIMGIAVVGITTVINKAKNDTKYESAQMVLDGIKKNFAITFATTANNAYGFDSSVFESGGTEINGKPIAFLTKANDKSYIFTGVWELDSKPSGCSATTKSYIAFDANDVPTLCLVNTDGEGVYGTLAQISAKNAAWPTPTP